MIDLQLEKIKESENWQTDIVWKICKKPPSLLSKRRSDASISLLHPNLELAAFQQVFWGSRCQFSFMGNSCEIIIILI